MGEEAAGTLGGAARRIRRHREHHRGGDSVLVESPRQVPAYFVVLTSIEAVDLVEHEEELTLVAGQRLQVFGVEQPIVVLLGIHDPDDCVHPRQQPLHGVPMHFHHGIGVGEVDDRQMREAGLAHSLLYIELVEQAHQSRFGVSGQPRQRTLGGGADGPRLRHSFPGDGVQQARFPRTGATGQGHDDRFPQEPGAGAGVPSDASVRFQRLGIDQARRPAHRQIERIECRPEVIRHTGPRPQRPPLPRAAVAAAPHRVPWRFPPRAR